MNNFFRALIAGYGAKKLGGGCLGTVLVFIIICVSLNFYQSCGRCENEATCSINRLFSAVRDETLKILSGSSLSDLQHLSLLPPPTPQIPVTPLAEEKV